jgi:hypothetical protein
MLLLANQYKQAPELFLREFLIFRAAIKLKKTHVVS